jgi:PAS domain S-box-containing protein
MASELDHTPTGGPESSDESVYRAIVEDQEEFIVRWRPDGTRTFVNDAYCRYFQASRDELIGTSFYPLVAEEDRKPIEEKISRLTPENPVAVDEHRVIRADGSTGWHAWTDRGTFDAQGRLVELQSVGRDVTERRLALDALRESEERYRTLVENAPEAITMLDLDTGKFCEVNDNAARMFGIDRERLLELGPVDMSPPRQPDGTPSEEGAQARLREVAVGGTPVFEWTHRTADGETFPCEVRLVRLPSSSRRLVRGSLTNIAERKRLEAELRQAHKMEAIGHLAGGIAHDFNNLLTAILGNLEISMDRLGAETPVARQLSEIRKAADRAAALTRQLLAFSRKQIVQRRVLNANAVIEDLSRMLRRLIGEDIDLVTHLDPRLNSIEADPGQIEQLIMNLAVNARDAMPEGGTLTIRTRDLSEGAAEPPLDVCVVIEVSDTGTGIEPELLPKVFEPFFTTKEPGKGTGLGLSTVYGIVKQNAGNVHVDSTPGAGATFKVYWPACAPQPESEAGSEENLCAGTETILLVEDEQTVREVAREALFDYGYNLLEARDGSDALRVSNSFSGPIDLVVTDVVMPGVGGRDLARRLAASRPGTRILFISGYSGELAEPDLADFGAAFLPKPYTPQVLATTIRKILDR